MCRILILLGSLVDLSVPTLAKNAAQWHAFESRLVSLGPPKMAFIVLA